SKSTTIAAMVQDVAQAIETLKRYTTRPLIAVDVRASDEKLFGGAGVDAVLCFPFDGGTLKTRVRRLLRLTDNPQPAIAPKTSLATLIARGFQRLKNA